MAGGSAQAGKQEAAPKWRRRKTARPAEIIAAAQAEFSEKGFAAARLDDIAARAGVSKGALYLYFETKTDLFGAVVRETVAPNIAAVAAVLETFPGPVWQLLGHLFERLPAAIGEGGVAPVAKLVMAESRNFPELARVWHDAVISPALDTLTRVIERAQARGEVRPGEPRLYAVQLISPVVVSMLWSEVFAAIGAPAIEMGPLVRQHLHTVLRGLLIGETLADWTAREGDRP